MWQNILKWDSSQPEWVFFTPFKGRRNKVEYIPNELNENVEQMATRYKNGMILNLRTSTEYKIKRGKIISVNQR